MNLIKIIISKCLQTIVVLFILSTITFILMKLSPGNPVDKILHLDTAQVSNAQIKATENKLGLNESLLAQWWHWIIQILHLDLGVSYQTNEPVSQEITTYAPPTLIITVGTLIMSVIISVPLGILAEINYHRPIDRIIRIFTSLSVSLPAFFIGILLLYIFDLKLNLLPPASDGQWVSYILPILTMSIGMCAYLIRLIRSNLLDLYQSPIVQASRLRGMSEEYILLHDLLKPALLPTIPLIGLSVGSLVGGTVVIENLFEIPGLGAFLVDSIRARDYPVIQGIVLFIGTLVIIINTCADLLSICLDPKQGLTQQAWPKSSQSFNDKEATHHEN
ncbi:peptide ABC transporter permease [Staphylococcus warneri]|uniref:nickel ABC transporter permease n=1 Tax=Staphylococcus warneri TaxID=1292 RepID=UPI000D1D590F|nr:nickel ABC transporter permease [Staphylococcus warneri]PTI12344.1 peptide ABC transporter permease [Staphylococcus warneri]